MPPLEKPDAGQGNEPEIEVDENGNPILDESGNPKTKAPTQEIEAVDEHGVPYKNRVKEWERKAKKAEEEKRRIQEELEKANAQKSQAKTFSASDPFLEQAKQELPKGAYEDDDEYDKRVRQYARTLSATARMADLAAKHYSGLTMKRQLKIKQVLSELSPEDRKLFGDEVEIELGQLPIDVPISNQDVERAILIAKGKKAEALVEKAKKEVEEKRTVLGGAGAGKAPGVGGGGPKRTPTQADIERAIRRDLPLEKSMEIDDNLKKKRESRKK